MCSDFQCFCQGSEKYWCVLLMDTQNSNSRIMCPYEKCIGPPISSLISSLPHLFLVTDVLVVSVSRKSLLRLLSVHHLNFFRRCHKQHLTCSAASLSWPEWNPLCSLWWGSGAGSHRADGRQGPWAVQLYFALWRWTVGFGQGCNSARF